jgi:transmembrane protein 33
VLRYLLSYITFNYYSSWAQISYRVAFLAAAATYGIVVYKQHIVRGNLAYNAPTILKLAGDENVQYLGKRDDKVHLLSGSRVFPAY